MNSNEELELKKEFQLERIILFSDAVFAIIITIMVIELKLPETMRDASADIFKHALNGIYIKLVAYAFSFFFIAVFWTRHVKLFGFLKDYNRQLLILNLLFLFCISLFPFAVTMLTGFDHVNSYQAKVGFNVYLVMVFICMLVFTFLTGYLIKHKKNLCYGTAVIEGQVKWKVLKLNYILIPLMLVIVAVVNMISSYPYYLGYVMALYGVITGRMAKVYYPAAPGAKNNTSLGFFQRRKARKSQKKQ